jgi:hypothetical protein
MLTERLYGVFVPVFSQSRDNVRRPIVAEKELVVELAQELRATNELSPHCDDRNRL